MSSAISFKPKVLCRSLNQWSVNLNLTNVCLWNETLAALAKYRECPIAVLRSGQAGCTLLLRRVEQGWLSLHFTAYQPGCTLQTGERALPLKKLDSLFCLRNKSGKFVPSST
jgi:hypothetical protein